MIHQVNYQTRLDWAGQHLQGLESEIRRWSEGNPCRVWTEFDLQSGNNLIWAEVLKPPPNKIGLILGDCLHNVRATLNTLIYELAVAHQKGPLSKSMTADSQFPVFLTDDTESMQKFNCMTRGIHPDAKTFIKELQPYRREGRNNTLFVLNRLASTDRHLLSHMAVVMPSTIPYYTTDISGIPGFTHYWEPFEKCTVIAEYPYATRPYTEMDMKQPPTFTVAFGERAPDVIKGWSIHTIMKRIYDFIRLRIVQPLIRYLT